MIFSRGIATLSYDSYVPSLRWRMGEYQALLNLDGSIKDRIVPLILIPEVEYDFEKREPKKSVNDHVEPFPDRFHSKWGSRPAWVGVHPNIIRDRMHDGRHIFSYVFEKLGWFGANAVPLLSINSSFPTLDAVRAVVNRDQFGIALSLSLEDLMVTDTSSKIAFVLSTVGVPQTCVDLIVDLRAPNYCPYEVFADVLLAKVANLDDLDAYRNFILVGTAMPQTLGKLKIGTHDLTRHDWLFYKTLRSCSKSDMRCPTFGDYTVVNPSFSPVDMRMITTAAKLIYTTPSSWWIRKGSAFRNNRSQMYDHCRDLLRSGVFKGSDFSNGDSYIKGCAAEIRGPSNQTRWKHVSINHHISQVVRDLDDLRIGR